MANKTIRGFGERRKNSTIQQQQQKSSIIQEKAVNDDEEIELQKSDDDMDEELAQLDNINEFGPIKGDENKTNHVDKIHHNQVDTVDRVLEAFDLSDDDIDPDDTPGYKQIASESVQQKQMRIAVTKPQLSTINSQ